MATITFDGPTQCIIIGFAASESAASVDFGADIYSAWKQWVAQADNAKYLKAIEVIGGQDKGAGKRVGSTFFLLNGWLICPDPQETLTELEIIDEVLPEVAGQPIYSQQLVDPGQSVFTSRTVPTASETVLVSTGSGLDATQAAQLALAAAIATADVIYDHNSQEMVWYQAGTQTEIIRKSVTGPGAIANASAVQP